jgi:2,3-bisphosphoglycerate-dependent phosphoglycerate mutase
MIRAIKTGWGISKSLKLPLNVIMDLHEGGGIFLENEEKELIGLPGKPKSYFLKNFPGLVLDQEMDETGWWNRPFEPYEIRKERAKKVINYLLMNHSDDDRIALFSHAGFFNYFLSALLNYTESESVRFNINNASISRIDIDLRSSNTKILYINQVNFLPFELIT